MLVIAGLSLNNHKPKVWDPGSEYFLARLRAVMVSYADFHAKPSHRKKAMEQGLHSYLGVPCETKIFLDNGAFHFINKESQAQQKEYEEFVEKAKPDWYPIPLDYIPKPSMALEEQRQCLKRTMAMNQSFAHNGFIPVIHVSRVLSEYIEHIKESENLSKKPIIALGGIVPNLLRAPKAIPYKEIIHSLWETRNSFKNKQVHVFGIGGTATVHVAALIGFDSVDSSGWRNRAARGIVQLPGKGDRMLATFGSWRGRQPNDNELGLLSRCQCPSCQRYGLEGLRRAGIEGFCNRATHNLWVLLEEAEWIKKALMEGNYEQYFRDRLDNTTYLPLIEQVLNERMQRTTEANG